MKSASKYTIIRSNAGHSILEFVPQVDVTCVKFIWIDFILQFLSFLDGIVDIAVNQTFGGLCKYAIHFMVGLLVFS